MIIRYSDRDGFTAPPRVIVKDKDGKEIDLVKASEMADIEILFEPNKPPRVVVQFYVNEIDVEISSDRVEVKKVTR